MKSSDKIWYADIHLQLTLSLNSLMKSSDKFWLTDIIFQFTLSWNSLIKSSDKVWHSDIIFQLILSWNSLMKSSGNFWYPDIWPQLPSYSSILKHWSRYPNFLTLTLKASRYVDCHRTTWGLVHQKPIITMPKMVAKDPLHDEIATWIIASTGLCHWSFWTSGDQWAPLLITPSAEGKASG